MDGFPWLLVAELMSRDGKPLSELVGARMAAYPCSGEINYTVADAKAVIAAVQAHYEQERPFLDNADGLSLEFADWRMNMRMSNTEPLLRLNVESRADAELVTKQVAAIERIISAG